MIASVTSNSINVNAKGLAIRAMRYIFENITRSNGVKRKCKHQRNPKFESSKVEGNPKFERNLTADCPDSTDVFADVRSLLALRFHCAGFNAISPRSSVPLAGSAGTVSEISACALGVVWPEPLPCSITATFTR